MDKKASFASQIYFNFLDSANDKSLESPSKQRIRMLHENEAETTCHHIILNFERRDGSSLQILVQNDV